MSSNVTCEIKDEIYIQGRVDSPSGNPRVSSRPHAWYKIGLPAPRLTAPGLTDDV